MRESAADDSDDSGAYWPVTGLSAVIAALTDADHPLSPGQKTFIIFLTFYPPHRNAKARVKKNMQSEEPVCLFQM